VAKIIHVANGELFGGAERQILTLIGRQSLRHSVLLVTICDGELGRRAVESGVDLLVLGASRRIDFKSLRKLRQALSHAAPATVHVHGYRAAVYVALAGGRSAGPIFKTEHGAPESRGAAPIQWAMAWLIRALDVLCTIWLRADVVFVTNQLKRRLWMRSLFNRSHVVPNGIDIHQIDSAVRDVPHQYREQRFPLVLVGRLDDVKGVDLAIDALKFIPESVGAHLNIIGAGPLDADLRKRADTAEVAHRVTFHGEKVNPYPYIRDARVLLITSKHEGMPFVVLEAFYLGVPVVAVDVGGLREVISQEKTGLLVKRRKPQLVAESILKLFSDRSLAESLSGVAREKVISECTSEVMARRYDGCRGYLGRENDLAGVQE
jgi:glycosyltransferase involved in cell wall biosynthesis